MAEKNSRSLDDRRKNLRRHDDQIREATMRLAIIAIEGMEQPLHQIVSHQEEGEKLIADLLTTLRSDRAAIKKLEGEVADLKDIIQRIWTGHGGETDA